MLQNSYICRRIHFVDGSMLGKQMSTHRLIRVLQCKLAELTFLQTYSYFLWKNSWQNHEFCRFRNEFYNKILQNSYFYSRNRNCCGSIDGKKHELCARKNESPRTKWQNSYFRRRTYNEIEGIDVFCTSSAHEKMIPAHNTCRTHNFGAVFVCIIAEFI